MTEKTLTTENIKPALDALRGELAPWPVVAKKQDRLNTAQLNAANSGITSSLVAQIIANTAAIRALESAITGTGLRALVVSSLPAVGTLGILYIVPVTTYDPDTDADVVNYSNEYIWIVAPDAPVTEGYYEQVGQTGIVINNGQLNITVNGTSVGTFTANQSGDTTAAITVPTNADYVDKTTAQSIAGVKTFSSTINGTASKAIADEDGTSIKTGYVNVAGNQTVTGQKTFSANIHFTSGLYQRNTTYEIGTTPASNINITQFLADKDSKYTGCLRNAISTTGLTSVELEARNKVGSGALSPTGNATSSTFKVEVQPNGTKTIYWDGLIRNEVTPYTTNNNSLGSSTNQWSSVYAQTYYYNGTEFLNKFVTIDTGQTITANKGIATYNATLALHNTQIELGTAPGYQRNSEIFFGDKNYSELGRVLYRAYTDGTRQMWIAINDKYSDGALSPTGTNKWNNLFLNIDSTGHRNVVFDTDDVIPSTNNAINLGTSTNKWKTLNGINPGALSLPDASNSVNIDTTGWVTDGSAWNTITSNKLIDGYLYINYSQCSADDYISVRLRTSHYQNPTFCVSVNTTRVGNHYLYVCVPVSKLFDVFLEIKTTGTLQKACIFPMQGNV